MDGLLGVVLGEAVVPLMLATMCEFRGPRSELRLRVSVQFFSGLAVSTGRPAVSRLSISFGVQCSRIEFAKV